MDNASGLEVQNVAVEDVSVLARGLEDFRTKPSVSSLQLPFHCTESLKRTSCLPKQLSTLNELLLYYIGAELTKIGPGKIAVRYYTTINFSNCIRREHHMVEASLGDRCLTSHDRRSYGTAEHLLGSTQHATKNKGLGLQLASPWQ